MAYAAVHAVLAPEHDGDATVAPAQEVFGEIETRFGEPTGAGHPFAVEQHRIAGRVGDHTAERPYRLPELLLVCDRPLMELAVVGRLRAPAGFDVLHERNEVRSRDAVCRGLPERLRHGDAHLFRFRVVRYRRPSSRG